MRRRVRTTPGRGRHVAPLLLLSTVLMAGCWDDSGTYGSNRWWSPAAAILLDDALTDIVVEVDYSGDYKPSPLTLSALQYSLETYTAKQRVTILEPTPIPPFAGVHSHDDVQSFHRQTRDFATQEQPWDGRTFHMHILYLNGNMEKPTLGYYVKNGEITILSDLLTSAIGPMTGELPGRIREDQVERKTLIHELGHAFGLVNLEVPMVRDHEDPNNRGHSSNPRSVMSYWNWTTPQEDPRRSAEETIDVPWQFDEYDQEDLTAFRASARTFSENYFDEEG